MRGWWVGKRGGGAEWEAGGPLIGLQGSKWPPLAQILTCGPRAWKLTAFFSFPRAQDAPTGHLSREYSHHPARRRLEFFFFSPPAAVLRGPKRHFRKRPPFERRLRSEQAHINNAYICPARGFLYLLATQKQPSKAGAEKVGQQRRAADDDESLTSGLPPALNLGAFPSPQRGCAWLPTSSARGLCHFFFLLFPLAALWPRAGMPLKRGPEAVADKAGVNKNCWGLPLKAVAFPAPMGTHTVPARECN